jgi:hypothetical protein
MHASRHQRSADAGSRGRLFSSSCEEQPAVSWHRSLSRSRHDGREHVIIPPVVVPERELVEVERLDKRPEPVDVGGMNLAADVLAGRVVDGLMAPLLPDSIVALVLVGRHQGDAIRDRRACEPFQRLGVGCLDHLTHHVALARDGADHAHLADRSAPALAALHPAADSATVPVLGLAADVGFIDLHDACELLKGFVLHRGADAVAHVPGGPELAHADVPLNLQGAHPFLGLAHDQDHVGARRRPTSRMRVGAQLADSSQPVPR